jgi:hypothetical protein
MGMCKPSGGIKQIFGKVGRNIPGSYGNPNTRTDMYDIDNPNELIQQRWYGPNGENLWDRDWKHKNENPKKPHKYPHDHYWDWSKKDSRPLYIGPNNEDTNSSYC